MEKTLINILKKQLVHDKGIVFISGSDKEEYFSYDQLYHSAINCLGGLQKVGLQKGSKLILQINSNKNYLILFWACILGGIQVVPLTLAMTEEEESKLDKIYEILNEPWIIKSSEEKSKELSSTCSMNIIYFESLPIGNEGEIAVVEPTDTAFIQFSSGSTGDPKGVILSHNNLVHNTDAIVDRANIENGDKTLSWMPLTHDMGMIGFHLSPLVAGISQYIMPTSLFIKQPLLWMDKAVEHDISILSSPNFGYQFFLKALSKKTDMDWDLSKIKMIFNGAEPISIGVCKEFLKAMGKYKLHNNVIFPVYGLAEATLGVTFPITKEPLNPIEVDREHVTIGNRIKVNGENTIEDSRITSFVDLGYPIKYTKLRITDDDNHILDEKYVGNIEIMGEGVTKGYINNPKANEDIFTEDHWLRTGDVGFLYEGHLYITGRKKDIIFINGQNYYSSDIEHYIVNKKNIKIGSCVACGIPNKDSKDELIIFIQHRGDDEDFLQLAERIKIDVARDLRLSIKYVLPCKKIHRTTSGKVKRYAHVEEYLSGKYEATIKQLEHLEKQQRDVNQDKNSLKDYHLEILELFQETLGIGSINGKEHFIALGGDSLQAQVLLSKINGIYGSNLELRDIYEDFTVEAIAKRLESRSYEQSIHIPKYYNQEGYPVLPSQEQLVILDEIPDTKKLFQLSLLYKIIGHLDRAKLQKAIDILVDKHESLRTTFHFDFNHNQATQKVHENIRIEVQEYEVQEEMLYEFVNSIADSFQLDELPLVKLGILKFENNEEKLFISAHHIIVDGTSLGILLKEIQAIYNGFYEEKDVVQMKDYAAWRQERYHKGEFEHNKNYWINQFQYGIPTLDLRFSSDKTKEISYEGEQISYELSTTTLSNMELLSRKVTCSKFSILFTAYAILLNKYNKSEDVVIGVPFANRKYEQVQNSIGMFINTLPFLINIDMSQSIRQYIKIINDLLMEGFQNGEYYSEEVLRNLQEKYHRKSLYNVVFIYQNMEIPEVTLGDAKLIEEEVPIKYTKTDITFELRPKQDKLVIHIEYLKDKYQKEDMLNLVQDFENILTRICSDEFATVFDITALEAVEQRKLLYWSRYHEETKKFNSIMDLFEASVLKYPEQIALRYKEDQMSYGELSQRINQLAAVINHQLPSNKIIGIWIGPSMEQIIGIYAVLKVGGAYVPIDKNHPIERIHYILQDSGCKLLLTDEDIGEIDFHGSFLDVRTVCESEREQRKVNYDFIESKPEDLAYILYTSGSTGHPKGVMVEQQNVIAYMEAFLNEFKLKEEDVMLHQASIGFDASVEEIFPILTCGGSIAIVGKEELIDGKNLFNCFQRHNISIVSVSPHLMNEINKIWSGNQIHTFISGGDVLKYEYMNQLIDCGNIYNTYGPTETTVCATYHKVSKKDEFQESIPIGRPIKNYEIYILDRNLRLCPVGVEGEICISGLGVTRGYLNNHKLTNKNFVKNPYHPEYKLYHTGDLGRWLSNGEIEYLGRCDNQINMRGYRIELGEIEKVLCEYDEIEEVVVVGQNHNNDIYLCAYVKGCREFTVEELRSYLKPFLPEYMIPSYFVNIQDWIMNTSGKIDKKMLPNPFDHVVLGTKYEEPSTNFEVRIAKIWSDILGIQKVGLKDDFFDLGGQSLKAIMLKNRLEEEFLVKISINYIFQNTTIYDQAKNLSQGEIHEHIAIERVEEKELYETSFMQKDMYSIQIMNPDYTNYNIVKAIQIDGELDVNKVKNVLDLLVDRHEAFRTAFILKDKDVYQHVFPELDNNYFTYVDGSGRNIDQLIDSFQKPYELNVPGLFHIYLIKRTADCHLLLLNIHHIIADATSIGIFLEEFCKLYNGQNLKMLKLTYKDYSEWQSRLIRQGNFIEHEKFWYEKLNDSINPVILPYDTNSSTWEGDKGATYSIEIPHHLVEKVESLKAITGTTTYMVLISAFSLLLSKCCNQKDLILGSPVVNRSNSDLFGVVGVFINTVIQKFQINEEKSIIDYLSEVKKDTIETLRYQDYPVNQLAEQIRRKNGNEVNQLFNVMFSLIEFEETLLSMERNSVKTHPIDVHTAMFDLTLEAMEVNKNITLNFEYKMEAFFEETIARLASRYLFILEQMVMDPQTILKDILVISREEEKQIISLSRGKQSTIDGDMIYDLIDRQAEIHPDNIALKEKEQSLTYKELMERTDNLALYFNDLGISSNELVAIHMEPSVERIVTILAILKAGGAYVPIDYSMPVDRIRYVLEDCKAKIFYTDDSSWNIDFNLSQVIKAQNIEVNPCMEQTIQKHKNKKALAYIIYTSGSTGQPKGVMVQHSNLSNYVEAFLDEFDLRDTDVMMQQASVAFDASIEEIYPILSRGGCLAIAKKEELIDPEKLRSFLVDNRISIVSVSPYLLNEINKIWSGTQIHTFISGGDVLRKEYFINLYDCGRIYNSYGPTEATVCATYYKVTNEEKGYIPIGMPIQNYGVYILDKELKLCPIGTVGEICISGMGVTKGYLNNTSLTEEKYVTNPYESCEKMYKTGDLGRWLMDGNIEYIGREDNQVNIRGYRVELGEIESRLLSYPEITEVLAINKEYEGEPYLCAYIKGDREFTIEELKKYLKVYLPAYMIPAYFVNIEVWPLNTSGKIDKNMLPEPFDKMLRETKYVEPVTEIEKKMVCIWSDILGVTKIGIYDNFFDLGGQSLKVIVLANKIEEEFSVHIPTSTIFLSPLIKELCDIISDYEYEYETLVSCELMSTSYEASKQQKNFYVLQQMAKEVVHYNMPAVFQVQGELDYHNLQQALNKVIQNNEIYRTSFHIEDDMIVQKIHDKHTVTIDTKVIDKNNLEDYISDFVKPFDLSKLPLIRMSVLNISKNEYIIVVDIHHIISDGMSISLFMKELLDHYLLQGPKRKEYQYRNYSEWQKMFVRSEKYLNQKSFWNKMYDSIPPVLNFSTDYTRPAIKDYKGNSIELVLDKEWTLKVKEMARQLHGTNFMVFYSIYSLLLSKYTATQDIVVGIPTLGRTLRGTHNLQGLFVNTLALRNEIKDNMTYHEYFADRKEYLLEVFDHQDYPFEELVNDLKLPYDSSRNPLFDTMFSYTELDEDKITMKDMTLEPIYLKYQTSKFDFGIDIIEETDSYQIVFNYATGLYKEETMERFAQYFVNILKQVIKDNNIEIDDITLLSPSEEIQIIEEFNQTAKSFKENRPIVLLIEEKCNMFPDRVAVEFNGHYLTYNDLFMKSNGLSKTLISQGIGPGDFIPVLMGRSLELVVTIYSIMKTGAAFVPLDINWPIDRINHIIGELQAKVSIVNKDSQILAEQLVNPTICCGIESIVDDCEDMDIPVTLDSTIYIIYTSGSTGLPKGVVVPNKGILNRFLWMNDYFGNDASMSVLQTTSHIYDSSVWQFFWPLINGGKTVLPNSDFIMNADYIIDVIKKSQISMIDFVPSVFNTIIYQLKEGTDYSGQLKSLQCVILGGEEIVPKTVYFFQSLFEHVRVFNLYGPTEASIGCICHEVIGTEEDTIPIGKPISNVKVYILDTKGNVVPIGVPGEIYLSGICLADGYYQDQDKTKAAFMMNPYKKGQNRVYKTGDLGKYREDGEILFLGRADNQVKIRGFRIELGEIESVIRTHEEVEEAAVITDKLENGDLIICAYIVGTVEVDKLKEYLTKKIPYYMVPSYLYKLEELPLTSGGKLNRKALPRPKLEIQEETWFIPSNFTEERLCNMYQSILNIEHVNSTLNFFEHGGNSLSATILLARIKKEFQVDIQLSDIFVGSTITSLAETIGNHLGNQMKTVTRVEKAKFYEASPAQKRMLVLNSLHGGSLEYNIPMVFKIMEGTINIELLEKSINQLVLRHEGLRTYFGYEDGMPVQYISEERINIPIIYDSSEDFNFFIHSLIEPFHMQKGPLFRVYIIHRNTREMFLFMDIHHIISDGVSIDIMMRELNQLYLNNDFNNDLTTTIYQYKDYSNWYYEFMKTNCYDNQKSYWLNKFQTLPPIISFESEEIIEDSLEIGSIVEYIQFDGDMADKINQYLNDHNITLYMYMLAAFNTLLYRLTRLEDIAIGTPVSGRTQSEFEQTIGLFVNTLVLRHNPKGNKSFLDFLNEVKENVITSIENQEYGIDDLVKDLKLERVMEGNPLFNIMFLVDRIQTREIRLGDVLLTPYEYQDDYLKFDMNVNVLEYMNYIKVELVCRNNKVRRDTAKEMLGYLHNIIKETLENPSILLADISLIENPFNCQIERNSPEIKLEPEMVFEFEF